MKEDRMCKLYCDREKNLRLLALWQPKVKNLCINIIIKNLLVQYWIVWGGGPSRRGKRVIVKTDNKAAVGMIN